MIYRCWLVLVVMIVAFNQPIDAEEADDTTIKVALYLDPPAADYVNNQYVGRNVDIANLLAGSIGKTASFLNCPFMRCLSELKAGRADMIVSVRYLAAREEFLSYLSPAFKTQNSPLEFFTLASSGINIRQYDDLYGLKIGLVRGSSYFHKFDNDTFLNKVSVTSHSQLIQMLRSERIDVFIEREESIKPWLSKQEYQTVFRLSDYKYNRPNASYIAISKKSPLNSQLELLSSKLSALIENGAIDSILQKSIAPTVD